MSYTLPLITYWNELSQAYKKVWLHGEIIFQEGSTVNFIEQKTKMVSPVKHV